jgi:hypothetical protein
LHGFVLLFGMARGICAHTSIIKYYIFPKVLFEFKCCYIYKVQQCNIRIWNRDWNVVKLIIINEIPTWALENINWFLEVDSQIDNPCT